MRNILRIVNTMSKILSIAERFSAERRRIQISQEELAEICGVKRGMIGLYERGKSKPNADVLAAFMKAGADVHYILLGRREDEPQPVMLAPDEIEIVDGYRASDDAGKEQIRLYVNAVATHAMVQETSPIYRKRIDKKQPK